VSPKTITESAGGNISDPPRNDSYDSLLEGDCPMTKPTGEKIKLANTQTTTAIIGSH